ncbi:DMT family transporter [Roseovarius arcticus]|uniref:DMT family transporter n=1 Tax=Roseovarius arcticus TaxID=2547404 RepID=UPI001FEA0545|nr:DMT family transporter [Roseovarius arcticus]
MDSEENAGPGWGIFWMVVTGILFVGVTALVKTIGARLPAAETAFLRYALGLVLLIPVIPAIRRAAISPRLWAVFFGRGAVHTIGVAMWFYAMAHIPLADVTAMNYLSPIYVTIGAALFLGERLALRRLIAILVALLGAVIILRPGLREVGPGHLAMLLTAFSFGISYLLAKVATGKVSPMVVVAMLSLTVTVGLAPFAALNWVQPTWLELATLTAVAVLATAGHYTMMLAFRAAPMSVTQPMTFLQLVWAVLLGTLVFGEAIDPYVVLGGLVIVGSVSFITWREALLKRRGSKPLSTPVSTATKV